MYRVAANWKGKNERSRRGKERGHHTFDLITAVTRHARVDDTHTHRAALFLFVKSNRYPSPASKTYTRSVVVRNRHGQRLASPRNKIMVIDYPTWKPPSGISITYVCIPTGNLPLIRSNSEVTQFTPASNLKWDCLMAQGTSKWAFPTSQGTRGPFRYPGIHTSYADDNPVIPRLLLSLYSGGRVSRKGRKWFSRIWTTRYMLYPRKSSPRWYFPRGNGQIGIVVNAPENSTCVVWAERGETQLSVAHPNPLRWTLNDTLGVLRRKRESWQKKKG